MKHATSRLLFAYWDEIRGERAAPDRSEVEPGRIRHVLADTFVLARDSGRDAAFRLAGTRCSALFGRDLKGEGFSTLWPRGEREAALSLVDTVVAETGGLVAGIVGRTDEGTSLQLELLLLPLRHRGRTQNRLIGALSPRTIPSWIGLFPLTSLELGSVRIVRTARPRPAVQGVPLAPIDEAAERRRRFTVVDGGRSSAPI